MHKPRHRPAPPSHLVQLHIASGIWTRTFDNAKAARAAYDETVRRLAGVRQVDSIRLVESDVLMASVKPAIAPPAPRSPITVLPARSRKIASQGFRVYDSPEALGL